MIGRFVIGVTRFAVRCAYRLVIEINQLPARRIVAGFTLVAIMVCWFIHSVATDTINIYYQRVIEDHIVPVVWCMAGSAFASIVVFRLHTCMAGFTICRCTFIYSFRMAVYAFKLSMLSDKRKEFMLTGYTACRKRNS